jgi:hypothetical protein
VVQDAEKTGEQEVIATINTGVAEGQRTPECLWVKIFPHPLWHCA